jgi:hypothetical protein
MMGLSENKKDFEEEINTKSNSNANHLDETAVANPKKPAEEAKIKEVDANQNHPYENRVFVCIGKIKKFNRPHVWVMTINDDYKGVTFWDPHTGLKYELKGRIEDSEGEKLKNFLAGFYPNYQSVKANKIVKKEKKESKGDDLDKSIDSEDAELDKNKNRWDEKKNPGQNDSYENVIAYNRKEDENQNILEEQTFKMYSTAQANLVNKIDKEHYAQDYDMRVLAQKHEGGVSSKKYDYIAEQQAEMRKKLDQESTSFSAVESFRDETGNEVDQTKLNMPYETLDLIFNRNNIWVNLNNHDPKYMRYHIHMEENWMPFFDVKDSTLSNKVEKIFTGTFDPFYSLTNFGNALKPKVVNKMRDSLIKELRVCITS